MIKAVFETIIRESNWAAHLTQLQLDKRELDDINSYLIPAAIQANMTNPTDIARLIQDVLRDKDHRERFGFIRNFIPAALQAGITSAEDMAQIINAGISVKDYPIARSGIIQEALPSTLRAMRSANVRSIQSMTELITLIAGQTDGNARADSLKKNLPDLLKLVKENYLTLDELIQMMKGVKTGIRDYEALDIFKSVLPRCIKKGIKDGLMINAVHVSATTDCKEQVKTNMDLSAVPNLAIAFQQNNITDPEVCRSIIQAFLVGTSVDKRTTLLDKIEHLLPVLATHGWVSGDAIQALIEAASPGMNGSARLAIIGKCLKPAIESGVRDGAVISQLNTAVFDILSRQEKVTQDSKPYFLEYTVLPITVASLAVGFTDSRMMQTFIREALTGAHSPAEQKRRLSIIPEAISLGIREGRYIAEYDRAVSQYSDNELQEVDLKANLGALWKAGFTTIEPMKKLLGLFCNDLPPGKRNVVLAHGNTLLEQLQKAYPDQPDQIIQLFEQATRGLVPEQRLELLVSGLHAAFDAALFDIKQLRLITDELWGLGVTNEQMRDVLDTLLPLGITEPAVMRLWLGLPVAEADSPALLHYFSREDTPAEHLQFYFMVKNNRTLASLGETDLRVQLERCLQQQALKILQDQLHLLHEQSLQIRDAIAEKPESTTEAVASSIPDAQKMYQTLKYIHNYYENLHVPGWGELSLMEEGTLFLYEMYDQLEKGRALEQVPVLTALPVWVGGQRDKLMEVLLFLNQAIEVGIPDKAAAVLTHFRNEQNPLASMNMAAIDQLLEMLSLMDVLALVDRQYEKAPMEALPAFNLEGLVEHNRQLFSRIQSRFEEKFHIDMSSLKEEMRMRQKLLKAFVLYAGIVDSEGTNDLTTSEKQKLILFYLALELKGLFPRFKFFPEDAEVAEVVRTMFPQPRDQEFIRQFIKRNQELSSFSAIFDTLGIDREAEQAQFLAVFRTPEIQAHDGAAMSPLEILKSYAQLSQQVYDHLTPAETDMLQRAAVLQRGLGSLGAALFPLQADHGPLSAALIEQRDQLRLDGLEDAHTAPELIPGLRSISRSWVFLSTWRD